MCVCVCLLKTVLKAEAVLMTESFCVLLPDPSEHAYEPSKIFFSMAIFLYERRPLCISTDAVYVCLFDRIDGTRDRSLASDLNRTTFVGLSAYTCARRDYDLAQTLAVPTSKTFACKKPSPKVHPSRKLLWELATSNLVGYTSLVRT